MDITEVRRIRFSEAEALAGGIAMLAEMAGLSEKYLRQVKAGFQGARDRSPRRLGDQASRKIEQALGKTRGWMDTPPSTVGPLSAAGKGEHRDGFAAALTDWRLQASPRSLKTIDRLTFLAKRNALTDADWAMIDTLAERFMKR